MKKKRTSFRSVIGNSSLAVLLMTSSITPVVAAQEIENDELPLAIANALSEDVIPYEYIVSFKEGVSVQEMKRALENYKVLDEHFQANLATVKLTKAQFNKLKLETSIEIIEPNAEVQLQSDKVKYQYSHEKTNVKAAWAQNLKGKGVKIAVIDSGISQHDDLKIAGGASMVKYTKSYEDDRGHGTHVAGIIGALDNGVGTIGVASEAEIYSVKVLTDTGKGDLGDIIAGFDWAINKGVDIINASLGTTHDSKALKKRIDEAEAKGIIVVTSAGNTGGASSYPALYDNVVAVSATNEQNTIASYSSRGSNIDLAAPGDKIVSTFLDNNYAFGSGTSLSAPYVSGMLALYKEAYPEKTAQEIVDIAFENALDLGEVGRDNLYGHGLIQFPEVAIVNEPTSINPVLSEDHTWLNWDQFSDSNRYRVLMEQQQDNGTYEPYRFIRTVGKEQFDLLLLEKDHRYRLTITPQVNGVYDQNEAKQVYVALINGATVISEKEILDDQLPQAPINQQPTTAIQLDRVNNKIYWDTFAFATAYRVKMERKQADGSFTDFSWARQVTNPEFDLTPLKAEAIYRLTVIPRNSRNKYDETQAIQTYIRYDKDGQKTLSNEDNLTFPIEQAKPEVPVEQTPVVEQPTTQLPPMVIEQPKEDVTTPPLSLLTISNSKQLQWPAVLGAKRYRVEMKQKNIDGVYVTYSYNRNVSFPQFDLTVLPKNSEFHLTVVPYINYAYDYKQAFEVYINTTTYQFINE